MCGIVGLFNFDGRPASQQSLRAMADALVHRGPDEDGYFTDGCVGLGHRRLSIIDLVSGTQPISEESGTVVTIMNGEIYNYRPLRADLVAKGHRLRTNSDTEVLPHMFEDQRNLEFLSRVNGMFAIAIYDATSRVLWLATDRTGKKPIYYYSDATRFAFASEIPALLRLSELNLGLDPRALDCYFHYQFIPAPLSIFQNIRKLPPARILRISADSMRSNAYWEPPAAQAGPSRPEAEYLEEFRALLEDAVRIRMISDVPLGSFLSGGLDSSVIVGSMAQISATPVRSFCVGFKDKTFDESPYARAVSDRFETDHVTVQLDQPDPRRIPDILSHFGEPFADSSAIPTYYLCQAARQEVTVALSGDGADELLAGYNRYVAAQLLERYLGSRDTARARAATAILSGILAFTREGEDYYATSISKKLRLLNRFLLRLRNDSNDLTTSIFETKQREQLFSKETLAFIEGASEPDPVRVKAASYREFDLTERMLMTDLVTYLPGDIHVKIDRMSMANSLEVRCPFMDYRIIEFLSRVPLSLKIDGTDTKRLLRNLARGMGIGGVNRPKHGFEVPISRWLRVDFSGQLNDLVHSDPAREFFAIETIENMIRVHATMKQDMSKQLWAVYVFLVWLDNFRAGRLAPPTSSEPRGMLRAGTAVGLAP